MKKADWRKLRRGEAVEHPLMKQPLHETAKNTSEEMVTILRKVAQGWDLGNIANLRPQTVEALWRRGLINVAWARVPQYAPMRVRSNGCEATERGRALLAIVDLRKPEEVATLNTVFVVPKGVTAVHVSSVGGGGGGGGGSRSYGGAGGSSPGAAGQNGASIGGGQGGAGGAGGNGSMSVMWSGPGAAQHVIGGLTPGAKYGVTIGAGGAGGKKKG